MMKIWVCEREGCGWKGNRPATMSAGGLRIKVCQKCLSGKIHQDEQK